VDEPLWRKTLCWGATLLFLTLPISVLTLRIVADSVPGLRWSESLEKAEFIIPYFQSLTALVFGLAGLNVWDRRNGKLQPDKPKKDSEPV